VRPETEAVVPEDWDCACCGTATGRCAWATTAEAVPATTSAAAKAIARIAFSTKRY
jgi:hypothetical protein